MTLLITYNMMKTQTKCRFWEVLGGPWTLEMLPSSLSGGWDLWYINSHSESSPITLDLEGLAENSRMKLLFVAAFALFVLSTFDKADSSAYDKIVAHSRIRARKEG